MPDAAGAQPLGQRALRAQLDLELAGEVLPLELLVLPHVRRDDPPDPLVAQQDPETPVVDAAVVRDDLQVAGPGVEDRLDEHGGHAAQAEAADGEGVAVAQPVQGGGGVGNDLVHAGDPTAGPGDPTTHPGAHGADSARSEVVVAPWRFARAVVHRAGTPCEPRPTCPSRRLHRRDLPRGADHREQP